MEIITELLPKVYLLKAARFWDRRGCLEVPFNRAKFEDLTGLMFKVDQTMRSLSGRGVIRGLHYQSAAAPVSKIVTCTLGKIFDVVVDLRKDTKTFGSVVSLQMTKNENLMLYVPIGCAHGYLSLTDQSSVFYYQCGDYNPDESRVLYWKDPTLNIRWPFGDIKPIVSDRDQQGITWSEYCKNPEF